MRVIAVSECMSYMYIDYTCTCFGVFGGFITPAFSFILS